MKKLPRIENIDSVSIDKFYNGKVDDEFNEVEKSRVKVVTNNNKPTCVLLSIGAYNDIIELLEDYNLLVEAQDRLLNNKDFISHE